MGSSVLRGLIAFTAAQPALVYAYAMQGSIKEIGTAWGIPLLAALLPVFAAQRGGAVRAAIPLAVAGAATVGFVGLAAAVWIAPVALIALVLSVLANRTRLRATVFAAATFAVVLVVLSFQSFVGLNAYVEVAGATVTAQNEFGNLLGPLRSLQMFGVWLTGDYRLPPVGRNYDVTLALIGVTIASGVLGLIWAWRRRAWAPAALLLISVLGWWYVTRSGSPWADAKALVIVSPAIVLTAMLGPVALHSLGRRLEAFLLAALIATGVMASNALAYHDVSLAPRDRLGELETIGDRIDGQGPTLYTEFEEFGKHFLREADPAGSSEGWQRRLFPRRNGQYAAWGSAMTLMSSRSSTSAITGPSFSGARRPGADRHPIIVAPFPAAITTSGSARPGPSVP